MEEGLPRSEARRAAPRSRAAWMPALVALLTLAAFALRTSGVGSLLPHLREVDAQIVDEAEQLILHGDWDPGVQRLNKYPTLLPWLAAHGPAPVAAGARGEEAGLEEHLAAAGALTLRMRWIVLLL